MFNRKRFSLKQNFQYDNFEPRYEESFTQTLNNSAELSETESIDTKIYEDQQIKQILAQIAIQQKKKHLTRKTDNTYMKKSLKRMKRSQFIYVESQQKQLALIPKQISRVITFTKKSNNAVEVKDELENSVFGAFFGFVIGDSIGAHMALQSEDLNSLIPTALLMNEGGTFNIAPGQGTDQTEIMLSALYGLLECGNKYDQSIMGEHYMKWLDSKPFDLPVLMSLAFSEVRNQKSRAKSFYKRKIGQLLLRGSRKNQKQESNLGFIRILPCTVYGLKFSDEDFQRFIEDELKLICPNLLVIETGKIYAKILRSVILERDHEKAFYEASKWVYEQGSQKLQLIWQYIQKQIDVSNKSNLGKLKTSFSYSMIECHKKNIDFTESLTNVLSKGGDCDSNCAIVMALIGAIVGFNDIPNFFKNKIINANILNSPRPRNQQYCTSNIIKLVPKLLKSMPQIYSKTN